MSNNSFVQIFRDLLRDPSVTSLPPSYRCVLFTLLDYACYSPCKQDDHGLLIDLLPGQFMCTIRGLADLANVGKNDAERSLAKFVDLKIVRQEVRHKKTIVTILWGLKIEKSETQSETKKRQERDTKEEQQENKNIKEEQQQTFDVVFSSLNCFAEIDISQKEKLRICKKYTEIQVSEAVTIVTSKGFIPEESILKSLNAALKYNWKSTGISPKEKASLIRINKEFLEGYPNVFRIYKEKIVFNCSSELSLIIENKEFTKKFKKLLSKNLASEG